MRYGHSCGTGMQPNGENSWVGWGAAASCGRLWVWILYETVKICGTAFTVVPLFFMTSHRTCVFLFLQILVGKFAVALSHCIIRRWGDLAYIFEAETPESTGKYRKLPENRKVGKSFLSHCRTDFRVDNSRIVGHTMRRISSFYTPRWTKVHIFENRKKP